MELFLCLNIKPQNWNIYLQTKIMLSFINFLSFICWFRNRVDAVLTTGKTADFDTYLNEIQIQIFNIHFKQFIKWYTLDSNSNSNDLLIFGHRPIHTCTRKAYKNTFSTTNENIKKWNGLELKYYSSLFIIFCFSIA